VDEVLAVGDEAFSRRCLEKFAEFARAGKTLLFVSHDLSLVAEHCRRAVWLDRGRVAFDGPSGETVARYREAVAEQEAGKRLNVESRELRVPNPASTARIGSGAAIVENVRLLDAAGSATARLQSGDAAALEMDVRAARPLDDFVFGFAINTVSGAAVFGSNTYIDGWAAAELSGAASVRLELPACALAPGVYSVDAAVHARDGSPYDYRRDVLRFEVRADRPAAGVWNPRRNWRVEGGVRWK